jgi:hypothetical protein
VGASSKRVTALDADITDILLHHSGGANQVWYMDGATVVNFASLGTGLNFADSTGWRLEAVNDFNHDGKPDWLMHNGNTGQLQIWYMDGINNINIGFFSSSWNIPDSSGWKLFGAYDFNRDGSPDLIWHHADGAHGLWYLDGTTVLGLGNLDSSLNIPDYVGWRMVRR